MCSKGDSGSPVIVPKSLLTNPQERHFDMEYANDALIVGIVSYANFSQLHESGAAGVLISAIRDWIDVIIPKKVILNFGKWMLHCCTQWMVNAFYVKFAGFLFKIIQMC